MFQYLSPTKSVTAVTTEKEKDKEKETEEGKGEEKGKRRRKRKEKTLFAVCNSGTGRDHRAKPSSDFGITFYRWFLDQGVREHPNAAYYKINTRVHGKAQETRPRRLTHGVFISA